MKDGWTVKTKDRSLSAQYEHTIVVTDNGCEILTLRKDDTIPAITAAKNINGPRAPFFPLRVIYKRLFISRYLF
jgi:hypothetical protein